MGSVSSDCWWIRWIRILMDPKRAKEPDPGSQIGPPLIWAVPHDNTAVKLKEKFGYGAIPAFSLPSALWSMPYKDNRLDFW